MLVFAGVTPHSPLLLESINKDQLKKVQKTRNAMKELSEELYATFPDTIILISEHPTSFEKAFSISVSDPYTFDLTEFGDLGFNRTYKPDIMLLDRMQRSLREAKQSLTLSSDNALNFASAVPLSLLTEKLPNVQLLPVTFSDLSPKEHFQFGQSLKDSIMASNKRIAVIASGDLSHALTSNSPAGFTKEGAEFDEKLKELITQKNTAGLVSLDELMISNAHETLYRQLLILFGVLERVSVAPHVLSYESPFGVGYLVANLVLK
jgi:MEMO1 family protein